MKREGKGQTVKTYTASVPQPDLSARQERVTVYFKADSGYFCVYVPPHIANAVHGHQHTPEELTSNGVLQAFTLDRVLRTVEDTFSVYRMILREEQRKRVIRFEYQRNRIDHHHGDISFTLTPAVALDYEVLWQAGKRLYRADESDGDGQLYDSGLGGGDPGRGIFVIDWTPERERFFKALHSGLCTAIERMDEFVEDIEANVERAIAAGKVPPLLGASLSVEPEA